MRTIEPDDATTRARIRDAAIRMFGRDGFRQTTVRAIAAEAGVSGGLVLHHFGSKDGLRRACDDYIMARVTAGAQDIGNGGLPTGATSAAINSWLTDVDANRPWLDYISRQITDGSELGDRLFDDLVDYTSAMFAAGVADGAVRPSTDERMRSVILTAYGLSALIFERHIGRAIGQPGMTSVTAERMTIPALEVFTHGVYSSDALLRAAHDALDPKGPTS